MVNTRENKSIGLVKSKGERVAFWNFLLKRMVFFFCKGAHGLGWPALGRVWCLGYDRWAMPRFFYLDLEVEIRNPRLAQILIYNYKGRSNNEATQNHDLT